MRVLLRRFLASYLCALVAIATGTLLALAIVDMLVDFDAIVEGGAAGLVAALLARVPERHLAEALPLASLAALACAAGFRGAWQAAGFVAKQPPGAASAAAVGLVVASAAALGAALWWRAPR